MTSRVPFFNRKMTGAVLGLILLSVPLSAREMSGDPPGEVIRLRESTLEDLRREKAKNLVEYEPSALEKGFLFIEQKRVMEYLRAGYHGFHPKFGGLTTGSGFALGPLYLRNFSDKATLIASAAWSFKNYQQYEAMLRIKPHRTGPVAFVIHSRYRSFPQEDFFGIGLRSSAGSEEDYHLEETRARFGIELHSGIGLGGGVFTGYRRSRADVDHSPEESVFDDVNRPGISGLNGSIDYWLTEFEFGLDRRDSPGNPRSGISIVFDHDLFVDLEDRFGFRRSEVEFQGYLPFFHKHRVLALRMIGASTDDANSQGVPFYDLPFVGGHNTLRGYEEYRFRDRKAVLLNLEYRFEAFIGLDVALFGDAGQVGRAWSDFRLSEFKTSYGGGFRFNTARSVFLRFDIGHSVEGTRFFFKFGNVF